MFRGEKPGETKLAPEWSLERVARHAIDFWLSTEDLPLPENRVTVDGDGKLTLAYTPTNDVPKQELYEKLKSMLGKLDMNPDHLIQRFAYMKNEIPVAGVAHQAGTCRFGADPADLGARRRLQGARARQPLRRRHERLPEHRRGEPGADGDGELAPRRRPPAGEAGLEVAETMAADPTATFFDGLAERGHEPLLASTSGTLRFELRDGRRTELLVRHDREGRRRPCSHANAEADAVVRARQGAVRRDGDGQGERDGRDAARRAPGARATSGS